MIKNHFKFCELLLIIIFLYIILGKILPQKIYEIKNKSNYNNIFIINNLDDSLRKYLCHILIFKNNYNCYEQIFTNDNFFDEVKTVRKDIDLLLKIEEETKIEALVLFITLIPFIENDSQISYDINSFNKKKFFSIFNIFDDDFRKYNKNNYIKIKKRDLDKKKKELINLLNYEWEIIPSKNALNILRHVINYFYDDICLNIFEKSLNINIELYIQNNNNRMSLENKIELISKKYYLIPIILSFYYYIRKHWKL